MKKSLITIAIVLLAIAAQAQIKMHSNGRITLQTLANSTSQGVVFGPAPNWNVDINGDTYFHEDAIFIKPTTGYEGINMAYTTNANASAWIVSYPNWNTVTFCVKATGVAYANNYLTFSQLINNSKGEDNEPVTGSGALAAITGLQGYYFSPEELEIPDLENDENVNPDAVEAMYADFEKRSVGLSGTSFLEAFPEGVRTDPQNRLCIDYQSVVTMLVEAVKEQQREIEEMSKILEEKGLMKMKK